MDKDDSEAKCPKCGSDDVVMARRIPWTGEALTIRYCRNCHHEWSRKPLDEEVTMEVSDKEMRKMLNAAWDVSRWRHWGMSKKERENTRYRDVSKILESKKKGQRKDGRDESTTEN